MDRCLEHYVRENFELKRLLKECQESLDSINSIIYCIGGPLNDNVKNFNKEQLKTFFHIAGYTEYSNLDD